MRTKHFASENILKDWADKKNLKFIGSIPTEDNNAEKYIAEMRAAYDSIAVVTCTMRGKGKDDYVILK